MKSFTTPFISNGAVIFILVISWSLRDHFASGYFSGAPIESNNQLCVDMTPRHDFPPQTSPSPFKITLDTRNVGRGGKVRVTLESAVQHKIKGFLAIGRNSSFPTADTVAYGSFSNLGDRTINLKSCSGLPNTAATHSWSDNKERVQLEWTAPAIDGEFLISVTFVESYYVCWAATKSEIIYVKGDNPPDPIRTTPVSPPGGSTTPDDGVTDGNGGVVTTSNPGPATDVVTTISATTTPEVADPIYEGCSETKGCFGAPLNCISTHSCDIVVAYQLDPTGTAASSLKFEISGKPNPPEGIGTSKYLALGLSRDSFMNKDDVFTCILTDEGTVEVREFYNGATAKDDRKAIEISREDNIISNAAGDYIDGTISCSFSVLSSYDVNVTEEGLDSFDLITQPFYLLLARGPVITGALMDHSDAKLATQTAIMLAEYGSGEDRTTSPPPPPGDDILKMYDGCGVTKGCFGLPSSCTTQRNCRMLVTYQLDPDANGVNLQLLGASLSDSASYVAVGLSSDAKMGAEHVLACRQDSDKIVVGEYYNPADLAARSRNIGVSRDEPIIHNEEGAKTEGYILCSFRVDSSYELVVEEESVTSTYDLATEAFYILLAVGSDSSSDTLGQHTRDANGMGVSREPIRFSDNTIVAGRSRILVQLHGALMIVAWLFCASTGMFSARYFKQTFTSKQPFGIAIWFHVHRVCMTLTLVFTIAAFVMIFVDVKAFITNGVTTAEKAHPILGVILMALALLQVCVALFRPAPKDSNRLIFNWFHWIVGNSAHFIGIANIFLAMDMSQTNLADKPVYWQILVGFIGFHVLLHVVMIIHTVGVDRKMQIEQRKRALKVGPLKPAGVGGEAPGTSFRTIVLVAYMLGAVAITASLVYMVVDALRA